MSVSIPSRGLWVFPPYGQNLVMYGFCQFQSLVGVYGFSRCAFLSAGGALSYEVSIPSRGLWVFPLKIEGKFWNRGFNP